MPDAQTIKVLVVVKAAPVMTEDLDETMCVAGAHLETSLLSRGFSGFLLDHLLSLRALRGHPRTYRRDGPGSGLSEELAPGV